MTSGLETADKLPVREVWAQRVAVGTAIHITVMSFLVLASVCVRADRV